MPRKRRYSKIKKPSVKFRRITVKNIKGYQVAAPDVPVARRRSKGKAVLQVPFVPKKRK